MAQVVSCEFCEISKNIFSHRTPPVTASETDFNHNNRDNDVYNINNVNDQLIINRQVSRESFDLAINYIFYHGLAHPNLLNFTNSLTSTSGTWSSMFVNYFEDLSAFLEIISFVREINVEMNLEAERALLSQFFAFLDPNYSCCLANQHSLLKVLYIWNILLWKRFKDIFLGGSLIGDIFSRKHRDLTIEMTINREVKYLGWPM